MRRARRLSPWIGCLCLAVGGFGAACGTKADDAREKGWKTVKIDGRTYVVTEVGKLTRELSTNR
jgi:hypothetical protein